MRIAFWLLVNGGEYVGSFQWLMKNPYSLRCRQWSSSDTQLMVIVDRAPVFILPKVGSQYYWHLANLPFYELYPIFIHIWHGWNPCFVTAFGAKGSSQWWLVVSHSAWIWFHIHLLKLVHSDTAWLLDRRWFNDWSVPPWWYFPSWRFWWLPVG